MPSRLHDLHVELFRRRPILVRELLSCAGIEISGTRAELASIDASQVAPAEYRCDATTVMRDDAGVAQVAVIVEVQLAGDDDKRWSWPVYVTSLRASLKCPVILLVVTPHANVARWARLSIETGHPAFRLRPIVIDYEHVPRITDADAARAAPELALLSALAHPELDVAQAAIGVIAALPEDDQKVYFDHILAVLPELAREALEAHMNLKNYEYQSDFARKYYSQGREEGREEGREDGLRFAIAKLVDAKAPGQRDVLQSQLRDASEATLTRVYEALVHAETESDVRETIEDLSQRAE